jgi:hypothetical protein
MACNSDTNRTKFIAVSEYCETYKITFCRPFSVFVLFCWAKPRYENKNINSTRMLICVFTRHCWVWYNIIAGADDDQLYTQF